VLRPYYDQPFSKAWEENRMDVEITHRLTEAHLPGLAYSIRFHKGLVDVSGYAPNEDVANEVIKIIKSVSGVTGVSSKIEIVPDRRKRALKKFNRLRGASPFE